MSLPLFLKTGAAVVDPHSMTELTATVQTLTPDAVLVAPRDLTSHEHADLERLRAPLAGTVDRTDSRAVSWFWDRTVPSQPGTPAPAGLVEWVGVALGDLLVTHVPGTRWVVCPGPVGPTLGVVGAAHPLAPVVPLPDAQDCWNGGIRGWIGGYLSAAAAHLAGVAVPQPRPSTENPTPDEPEDGSDVSTASRSEDTGNRTTPQHAAPAHDDRPHDDSDWAPVVVPTPGAALPCRSHAAPASVPAAGAAVATAAHPTAHPSPETATDGAPSPVAEVRTAGTPRPLTDLRAHGAPRPSTEPSALPAPLAASSRTAQRPTNLPHPPAAAAQDLALRALQHALVVLRRGPFDREAFVMLVDDSGTRTLACTGEPEQALRQARDTARTSGARTAAIGWIDRHPTGVPDPRQGFPAVLVEASEAGSPGLRVAHRFVEDALGTGPLGDPVLVGEVPPLL